MIRLFAAEDGTLAYSAGDLLVERCGAAAMVAVADGRGVSVRPATGEDLAQQLDGYNIYWRMLFGQRMPLIVAREFDLAPMARPAWDVWLGAAEAAAAIDLTGIPHTWRVRAIEELRQAAEAERVRCSRS